MIPLTRIGAPTEWKEASLAMGFDRFVTAEDDFSTAFTNDGEAKLNTRICGVYFWITADGQTYVGKSKDIRSRLRQHRKFHRDLTHASFQPISEQFLAEEERRLIQMAERAGWPLRNVLEVSKSTSQRELDRFLEPKILEEFPYIGNPIAWTERQRQDFVILGRRQKSKLASYMDDPEFLQLTTAAVTTFVTACIPEPLITEHRFWSVTLFPKGSLLVARVNAGIQEVFTVAVKSGAVELRIISPAGFGNRVTEALYRSGARASHLDWETCADVLQGGRSLETVRGHVVSLMRLTSPLNSASHCPGLLDVEVARRLMETSK